MIASALKVLGGIFIGVGIGTQWARVELDRYYRQKGEEFVSQQYRAMQAAWTDRQEAEQPAETEEGLVQWDISNNTPEMDGPDTSDDAIIVGGAALLVQEDGTPSSEYNEQAGVYAASTMLDGISYISEDDYNEEDGNEKEQISVHMNGDETLFVHGGDVIEEAAWKEMIGETILIDFFRNFQPQVRERVLYVRNHRRGEDYEVFQVFP